jgi:hypothetical protein
LRSGLLTSLCGKSASSKKFCLIRQAWGVPDAPGTLFGPVSGLRGMARVTIYVDDDLQLENFGGKSRALRMLVSITSTLYTLV